MINWLTLLGLVITWAAAVVSWTFVWQSRKSRIRTQAIYGRMLLAPEPPVNVQLHMKDGRVIPVDTALVSHQFVWGVTTEVDQDQVERVTVDQMPPHTSLAFRADAD